MGADDEEEEGLPEGRGKKASAELRSLVVHIFSSSFVPAAESSSGWGCFCNVRRTARARTMYNVFISLGRRSAQNLRKSLAAAGSFSNRSYIIFEIAWSMT